MKVLSQYARARREFLNVLNAHHIEPTLEKFGDGFKVKSLAVQDCPAVRHAIRKFAAVLVNEIDCTSREADQEGLIHRVSNMMNFECREERENDWLRVERDREDGIAQADLEFKPYADDYLFELMRAALREETAWNSPKLEANNAVEVTISELGQSIASALEFVRKRANEREQDPARSTPWRVAGHVRIIFEDKKAGEQYQALIQPLQGHRTQVSGSLNGRTAHQLNSRAFSLDTPIGAVMVAIAGAPVGTEAAEFFA